MRQCLRKGSRVSAILESDEELAEKARGAASGDLRAFEALVHRHEKGVLANCRFLTGSAEDAEDLAQEVFVKIYFRLSSFEGRSSFRTWFQRIKVNHCLNFIRKTSAKSFVDADDPAVAEAPEMRVEPIVNRDLDAADDRERIRATLDAMSSKLRIPLVMRDMDGLSYAEIATELGIQLSAAKMRIKRAREEFRARFATASDAAQRTRL